MFYNGTSLASVRFSVLALVSSLRFVTFGFGSLRFVTFGFGSLRSSRRTRGSVRLSILPQFRTSRRMLASPGFTICSSTSAEAMQEDCGPKYCGFGGLIWL
jgi:hypothetical protein